MRNLHISNAITDDAKWIELLKLPDLTNLTIDKAPTEEPLKLIPEHCSSVTCLKIASFEAGDWILQLKWLEKIKTDTLFDFDLFKKMIRGLYYLKVISPSESYEIQIEDGVVEFTSNRETVLREPKSVFVQATEPMNYWSDLFSMEF